MHLLRLKTYRILKYDPKIVWFEPWGNCYVFFIKLNCVYKLHRILWLFGWKLAHMIHKMHQIFYCKAFLVAESIINYKEALACCFIYDFLNFNFLLNFNLNMTFGWLNAPIEIKNLQNSKIWPTNCAIWTKTSKFIQF